MKLESSRQIDAQGAARHIGQWMSQYLEASGLDGWVVGVSGGIDSAVTSTLAALTGKPTTLLRMPIHQAVDQDQRGADHIAWLESTHAHVSSCVVDLTSSFDGLSEALEASGRWPVWRAFPGQCQGAVAHDDPVCSGGRTPSFGGGNRQ